MNIVKTVVEFNGSFFCYSCMKLSFVLSIEYNKDILMASCEAHNTQLHTSIDGSAAGTKQRYIVLVNITKQQG